VRRVWFIILVIIVRIISVLLTPSACQLDSQHTVGLLMIRRRLRFRTPQAVLRSLRLATQYGPLTSEAMAIEKALGQVLAQDITSTLDIPHFVRPWVDGYATKARWTRRASSMGPVTLRLAGRLFPEDYPKSSELGDREAFYVTCGAPVPKGADCVIKAEDARSVGSEIRVLKEAKVGEGLSRPGEDVRRGSLVLKRGQVLRAQDLGLIVALGKREVTVFRKPKLAILSVGDELVDPDHFGPDRIVNNYAYVISAATSESGGTPVLLGIAPDDPDSIAAKLSEGVQLADAVATIGGCSVGAKDFVPDAIARLGEVIAHGVKIRPGHVAGVGVVRGKPVFMLPGHISSCTMAFYVFVVPTLARLAGIGPSKILPSARAELSVAIDKAATHTFLRLRLKERRGRLLAEPIHGGTNILSSLSRANGFVLVPPGTSMRKGQAINVTLFGKLEHASFDYSKSSRDC